MLYDTETLRAALLPDRERFEAALAVGQTPNWSCDQRTKDIWCLGHWLNEKLSDLPGDDRRNALGYFNRKVRAEPDPFALAALIMNKVREGGSVEWSRR